MKDEEIVKKAITVLQYHRKEYFILEANKKLEKYGFKSALIKSLPDNSTNVVIFEKQFKHTDVGILRVFEVGNPIKIKISAGYDLKKNVGEMVFEMKSITGTRRRSFWFDPIRKTWTFPDF